SIPFSWLVTMSGHRLAMVLFRFACLAIIPPPITASVACLPACHYLPAPGGLADGVSGAGFVQCAAGDWFGAGAWGAGAACLCRLLCGCATFRAQCPSAHRPEWV